MTPAAKAAVYFAKPAARMKPRLFKTKSKTAPSKRDQETEPLSL